MPYPSTREIVNKAWKMGIVVPAYNVPYLPMLEPIVRALRDSGSFGLIQVARLETVKFKAESFTRIAEEYGKFKDPNFTRLHLDHVPVIDEDGLSIDYVEEITGAMKAGYESVMVDGSRLPFEENVAATRKVVEAAKRFNVPVEGELGAVIGHEAGPMPPYEELFSSGKGFTDPREASEFVKRSNVDWLSVAIGNFHGAVAPGRRDDKKIAARLNIEHLKKINAVAGVPLVLHGGSGIQKECLREAFKNGIAKINVGTNIRQPYERGSAESAEKGGEMVYAAMLDVIKNELGVEGTAGKLLG
ncbi:MAG: class II fructose-bisphosphate aldolase [Planctomycetota bacterium]|jgi:ketose-bisphosphate aldolase|nr:class II fructose-bisphosphate aldolase [Planctomycetota bacterium]